MTTKYILHGGFAQEINSDNDLFFDEILKNTKESLEILLVEFAHSEERWEINLEKDKNQFERVKRDKELKYVLAREDIFIEQIKNADVIYISGGTTVRLLEKLDKFPNLKEHFLGKVVAGESAGANVLSTYCYSKSGGGVIKGLGTLPLKLIVHYIGEHKDVLSEVPENLEVLLLPNHKYKVFNI